MLDKIGVLEDSINRKIKPSSSRCSSFKPGPRFFYTLAAGSFATASIATISSLLTSEQNQKLFALLPDNIRESTISTLTAACQNVKGNYATYITAAVILLIIVAAILYYNRAAIKEKLGLGAEDYQPLEHNLART